MSTTSSEGTDEAAYETVARGSVPGSGGGSSYWSNTPPAASSDYVGNGEANLSRGAITSRTAPAARPAAAQPSYSTTSGAVTSAVQAGVAAPEHTTALPDSDPMGMGAAAAAAPADASGRSSGAGAAGAAPRKAKGPRRVRLAVARVDPWSVMKMSFLLSVALGIAGVILTAVLWMILSTMNVFVDIEGVLQSLQTSTSDPFSIKDYVGFGRVVSLSIVIGVIDVILLTAIATVMAFLYNICSALVGGIQLTLTDD